MRAVLVAVLLAGGMAGMSAPAQAHRDGCHRWHSCPSDSGSYVCGDLGNDSECPGGGDEATVPEVEADHHAPARPKLSAPQAGPWGAVSFTVKAERGSSIVVTDEDGVVKRLTASGRGQQVHLRTTSGVQTFRATATDSAGNKSDAGTVTVTADSTRPKATKVSLQAASATDVSSVLEFTTEPGISYDLRVGTRERHLKGTTTASDRLTLWLPNGRYPLVLALTDQAGNRRAVTKVLRVAVSGPEVKVRQLSPERATAMVLGVTAPARSTGRLVLAGHSPVPFTVGRTGSAEIALEVKDGSYPGAEVTLTDAVGRTVVAVSPPLVVDSVPPALRVTVDAGQAAHGRLVLSALAESQARVRVNAGSTIGEEFLANAGARTVEHPLAAGTYVVKAVATDAAGNATAVTRSVTVVVPWTLTDWIVAAVLAFALLTALGFGWRRRSAIAAWRQRRRQAAAEAAHVRALADYSIRRAHFERAESTWRDRRAELAGHVRLAETASGTPAERTADFKPRRGELVMARVNGALVEERTRQGQPFTAHAGSGTVTISDQRIVFTGDKTREWAFDKLTELVDVRSDTTLLKVDNRKTRSGVIYPVDTERTRILIHVAAGRRADSVRHAQQALAQHDARRPVAPPPPG